MCHDLCEKIRSDTADTIVGGVAIDVAAGRQHYLLMLSHTHTQSSLQISMPS